MIKFDTGVIHRFESKFDKKSLESCWIWQGKPGSHGYGQFSINGETRTSHRTSYEIYKGVIPQGMFVCHKCDVRLCVNPWHLFLGTPLANMQDRDLKGRADKRFIPKLKEQEVATVIAAYESGKYTTAMLASMFNVTRSNIELIVNGGSWKRINRPIRKKHHRNAKINMDQAKYIVEKYATGEVTQAELARQFNVSFQSISKIILGQRHVYATLTKVK